MHYQSPFILWLFAGVIQLSAQTNALNNGGMESWSGNTPAEWVKESGCALEPETGRVADGAYSVRLTKTGSSNRGLYQDVGVQAGDVCSFSVRVQNSDAGAYVRLTIAWYQGTSYLSQYAQSGASAGAGAWQMLGIQEAAVPINATMARCRIRVYGDPDLSCLVDQAVFSVETSLSVMLLDFWAEWAGEEHRLCWRTASEVNTAGYRIRRALMQEGPFEDVTLLIPAKGNDSAETRYEYICPRPPEETIWYRLEEVTLNGHVHPLKAIKVTRSRPRQAEIETGALKNFPNPFNPDTQIAFTLTKESAGMVTLNIRNMTGQPVITLIHEMLGPGKYTAYWHGLDAQWQDLASGIYLCELRSSGRLIQLRRMIKVE